MKSELGKAVMGKGGARRCIQRETMRNGAENNGSREQSVERGCSGQECAVYIVEQALSS